MKSSEPIPGLNTPWMNVAGFMGYMPHEILNTEITMGAFVTNPISLNARTPAHNRCLIPYTGGVLLHNGHPNPGIKHVLSRYQKKWQNLQIPIWAHLLPQTAYECQELVKVIEDVENITALEVGLPPGVNHKEYFEIALAAASELPVYICMPMDKIEEKLITQIYSIGLAGVILSAPRGVMMQNGKMIHGRLFGSGLHPLMLRALHNLRGCGLPVIAGCGIYTQEQGQAALDAGASALQVDLLCWRF